MSNNTSKTDPRIIDIIKRASEQDKKVLVEAKVFVMKVLNDKPALTNEFLRVIGEKIAYSLKQKEKEDTASMVISKFLDKKESVYLGIGNEEKKLSDVLSKEDIFMAFLDACFHMSSGAGNNPWNGYNIDEKDAIEGKYPDGTFKDALYEITMDLYPEWVRAKVLERN